MKLGEKLTAAELNSLLNSWDERSVGHASDREIIAQLEVIGEIIGYGALHQLAGRLYEIQYHGIIKTAAAMKRERFKAMGWKLPDDFEQVAAK